MINTKRFIKILAIAAVSAFALLSSEMALAQPEEKPVPPGIEKQGRTPGKGSHKGWEKGKHKGWEKADKASAGAEAPKGRGSGRGKK